MRVRAEGVASGSVVPGPLSLLLYFRAMKRFLPLVLFLAAWAAFAAEPQPIHVFVVGTTDLHGSYDSHHDSRSAPAYGGLPLIDGYLETLRANHGRVIVVDSGDLFQGTLESNFFEGEPVVKGYNALGYDAAAVGNHEFDYGPVGPDSVARLPGQDPLGALKKNAKEAKFPFLSANLATLAFGDPVAATVSAAKELRAAGAEGIVVIAHMGGRCRNIELNPEDSSSCEKDQEAMRFLQALPKGTIDAYFAGHTHSQMHHYINGVPALQPSPNGREIAILDMTIDPVKHSVSETEMGPLTMICAQVYEKTETCDPKKAPAGASLVPRMFEGKAVAESTKVAAIFKPYLEQVAAKRN